MQLGLSAGRRRKNSSGVENVSGSSRCRLQQIHDRDAHISIVIDDENLGSAGRQRHVSGGIGRQHTASRSLIKRKRRATPDRVSDESIYE
jgi:hypothetical protein